MTLAIYPGSFDPVTKGHIDVIKRAVALFGKVIVAVGDNPGKQPLFTSDERVALIKESTSDIPHVEVDSFSGLFLDFVMAKKGTVIVRGLRAVSDFEFEFQRALMNRELDHDIETIFIMTKADYVYLNSSIVKEIAMFGGSVSKFVPSAVEKALQQKFPGKTKQ